MVNIVSVEVATGPVKRVFGVTALRIQTNFTYEPAQITGIGRGAQVLQLILEQRSRVLEQYAARQPQTQQVGQI